MGANSFRKRVFQGPLTLGLHSTTFRSALPSATLPYPRKFLNRAKPRTCSFRFLLFPSVTTDVRFLRVLSQVFTCSGTRANLITALNRAFVLFRFLHSPSVTTDVCFSRVLSQVFTCSGTRASFLTAQTAH